MRLLLAVSAERNDVVERILFFGWKNLRLFTNITKLAHEKECSTFRVRDCFHRLCRSSNQDSFALPKSWQNRHPAIFDFGLARIHDGFGNLDRAFPDFCETKRYRWDTACESGSPHAGCLADAQSYDGPVQCRAGDYLRAILQPDRNRMGLRDISQL